MIDDHRVPMKSGQVTASELPADWVDSSIADLASHRANAIVGGPFGSDLVSADYVAYGVPVIRGQNMAGRSVGGDFVFVSREKAKALSSNTARPGDILFTQRGTLGQVAIVQNDEFDEYLISHKPLINAVSYSAAPTLGLDSDAAAATVGWAWSRSSGGAATPAS